MFAFTLAEVLITLVIIGVIAAMTVPTLINKTNNQEYVSKLKKAYSTFAQATNLIISEEGTPNASKGGWASSSDNMYQLYKKHLINAKECGSEEGCFNQAINMKYLNGNPYPYGTWDTDESFKKLVLADGTQALFEFVSNDCKQSWGHGDDDICAAIWFDLNGKKKPKKLGRDIFTFVIKENGMYPRGCNDESNCTTLKSGHNCACKVLREGAMNY